MKQIFLKRRVKIIMLMLDQKLQTLCVNNYFPFYFVYACNILYIY